MERRKWLKNAFWGTAGSFLFGFPKWAGSARSPETAASNADFKALVLDMSEAGVENIQFSLFDNQTGTFYSGWTDGGGNLDIPVTVDTSVEEKRPDSTGGLLSITRDGLATHAPSGGVLKVFDLRGRKLKEVRIDGQTGKIGLGDEFSSGTYGIVFETNGRSARTTVTVMDGKIIGFGRRGKNIGPGLAKNADAGSIGKECRNAGDVRWALRCVDGQGYDSFLLWTEGLSAGVVHLNRIPSWKPDTPYDIGTGYNLIQHILDDGAFGQMTVDDASVRINNGAVEIIDPTQDHNALINVTYRDVYKVNLSASREFQFSHVVPKGKATISGRVLDVELQGANLELRGWVEVDGTRYWADANGNYSLQVNKGTTISELRAGYADSIGNAASFISTIRNVRVDSNLAGKDIAVLKTNDLQYTSALELKAIICYANTTMKYGSGSSPFLCVKS